MRPNFGLPHHRSARQLWQSLAITVGAVSVVLLLDGAATRRRQTELGTRFSQQLLSQVDGLVLNARLSGDRDPLAWAVSTLTQGPEPRVLRFNLVPDDFGNPLSAPVTTYEKATGVFTLAQGRMRIELDLGYHGAFGTRSPFMNDLSVLLFVMVTLALALLWPRESDWSISAQLPELSTDPVPAPFQKYLRGWVTEARLQMVQLGIQIRDLLREVQTLTQRVTRSRQFVTELRTRIHGEITELHQGRKQLQASAKSAEAAVQLAIDVFKEIKANATEENQNLRALRLAVEIHNHSKNAQVAATSAAASLNHLEAQLEPWAMEADLAFQEYADFDQVMGRLDGNIKITRESIIAQSQSLQSLNRELESSTAVVVTPQERQQEDESEPEVTFKKSA